MDEEADREQTQATRVLVVDDDESIRELLFRGLQKQGFVVATAGNGRKALQTLMQQDFDVLVVDLRMQEMDGLSFLQEALKIWPWLGVVICSGYATDDAVTRARGLGVTRILEKPVGWADLVESITGEAAEKRGRRTDIPGDIALAFMRDHLKVLNHLGEQGVEIDTLAKTLEDFSRGLAHILPSATTGVLVSEGTEKTLLLAAHSAVSPAFLDSVQEEVLARYRSLSGDPVDKASVRVQIKGIEPDESGPATVGSTVSVPLLSVSDQEIRGVLTMASPGEGTYTPGNVSLLYHAANHISAILLVLERMHMQAIRDPLSALFNRAHMEEELERNWLLSRRYRYSMGVVVADIDHFKSINDGHGHAVGDAVVQEFARLMEDVARASDIVARYGGDEFVVILPRAGDADAQAFADRLLETAREHVFCADRQAVKLTLSIGISTSLRPEPAVSSVALLDQADRALYMAKREGRNRVCSWLGSPDEGVPVEMPRLPAQVPASGRILVVDDEESVRRTITGMLERDGYEVSDVGSADEALAAVRERPEHYDVVLTDLVMPGKDGLDLLRELGAASSVLKIVVTGRASLENAVQSLREGAHEFIRKPVGYRELSAMMSRAVDRRRLQAENARYQAHLEEMVQVRSRELAVSLGKVKESYDFTLEALVNMLDAREHRTGKHSARTREMTLRLARDLGFGGRQLDVIGQGALLHDIGKIGIPDRILLKPARLLPDEWEIMKTHPEIGRRVLQTSTHLQEAAEIVYSHHERYDGSGYPRGLSGTEICVGARIFAVADSFDSMCSYASYRTPRTVDEAVDEVRACAGVQFDPEVVTVFLQRRNDLAALLEDADAQGD